MDWTKHWKMLTKVTATLIIVSLLIAALIASVVQIINIDAEAAKGTRDMDRLQMYPTEENDLTVIGDETEQLMWFLQISDIHLSIYFDPKRADDLETFCTTIVDTIRPDVVLATGDLTDSRTKDPLGSDQHESEWIMYSNILKETNVTNKTVWLDMRGNHDDFNIHSWTSSNNYYAKYSVRGKEHEGHYNFNLRKNGQNYSFIGVDAALTPGPKRPFNFIGLLKEADVAVLKNMSMTAIRNGAVMTIWFGHYPSSSIASPQNGFRKIVTGPYLCGHFHTVMNIANEMYATQATGYLELEVADWKANRKFRLAAVDHALFSFVDVKLNQWPIILITNPKPSLFINSLYEPSHRIKKSTHIRAIAFSPYGIKSVKVKINNEDWIEMRNVSQSLYVTEWTPSKYSTGLHVVVVKVTDDEENERTTMSKFSLDGSKPDFSFAGRFLLRINTRSLFSFVFFSSVITSLIPLLIMRALHMAKKGRVFKAKSEYNIANRWIYKLYLLASNNYFFIPMIGVPLYATFGPWFIGYIIEGHLGICFVWGIILDGSYLPTGFTYIFGSLLIIFFHIPMIFCLSHVIYCRYVELSSGKDSKSFFGRYLHIRFAVSSFFLFVQVLFALSYCYSYGLVAFVFGFLNTWTLIVYAILLRLAATMPAEMFPEAVLPKQVGAVMKQRRNESKTGEGEDVALQPSGGKRK